MRKRNTYNKNTKTKSLFCNVINILKTRNAPSLMDILYLKKVKAVLEAANFLKPKQAFRVRELCDTEITPQMCMDGSSIRYAFIWNTFFL